MKNSLNRLIPFTFLLLMMIGMGIADAYAVGERDGVYEVTYTIDTTSLQFQSAPTTPVIIPEPPKHCKKPYSKSKDKKCWPKRPGNDDDNYGPKAKAFNPALTVRGGFIQVQEAVNGDFLVTWLPISRNGDYNGLNHQPWWVVFGNENYMEMLLGPFNLGLIPTWSDNDHVNFEVDYCFYACPFWDVESIDAVRIWPQ